MLVVAAVVVLAAIVMVPLGAAGYFGTRLFWSPGGSDRLADRPPVPEPSREVVPPPAVPPPEPRGPVLRPVQVTGEEAKGPLVSRDDQRSNRYRIQGGDTLSSIAIAHYGDSTYIQDILQANPGLDANRIYAGHDIILPPRRGENAQGDPKAYQPEVHVVRPGDTLIGIAQYHYGDSAMYLKIFELNRDQLNSVRSPLHEGMRLRLPPPPND